MKREFLILNLIAFVLFGTSTVFAQPTITSVSGTINHKDNLTINGSGFGIKSPVEPRIWDACDDYSTNDLDTYWPGDRYPKSCSSSGEVDYQMAYRDSYHGMQMPHNKITKYICAAATTCGGSFSSSSANNVFTTADWESPKLFAMYYYRVSPTFSGKTGDMGGPNMKEIAANGCDGSLCGTYLNGTDTYVDWCNSDTPPEVGSGSDPKMKGGNPSNASDCGCGTGEYVATENPMDTWIHIEWEWDTTGYVFSATDVASVYGKTPLCAEGRKKITDAGGAGTLPKSISIGGFVRWPRVSATGNYRYWAGLYLDDTYARVMLGNNPSWDNCTIREPQIPSAWNDDSITCSVNLGALPDSGMAYLFVFDTNNNHNSTGYPITVNTGGIPGIPGNFDAQ